MPRFLRFKVFISRGPLEQGRTSTRMPPVLVKQRTTFFSHELSFFLYFGGDLKWRFLFGDFLRLTFRIIFVNYFCLQNLIFLNFGKKFFLTILKSTCLEFCASNYICCHQNMHKHYYILIKSVICFTLMVTKHTNIFYHKL